jgi:hypothetical protein
MQMISRSDLDTPLDYGLCAVVKITTDRPNGADNVNTGALVSGLVVPNHHG